MIERGLHGELVALAAPSLETYLNRVNAPELLWQFYERNKNHAAAAKILDSLASKVGYVYLLDDVNYFKIRKCLISCAQTRDTTVKKSRVFSSRGCLYEK